MQHICFTFKLCVFLFVEQDLPKNTGEFVAYLLYFMFSFPFHCGQKVISS